LVMLRKSLNRGMPPNFWGHPQVTDFKRALLTHWK
jgi:hypothetical protein